MSSNMRTQSREWVLCLLGNEGIWALELEKEI
jgi:hypothetical protein